MPFCKRTILPKDVCRRRRGGETQDSAASAPIAGFVDLVDVCGFTLCAVLRQLSDLSRHSVRILEELEGELVAVCRRSGTLEGKVVGLQRHVAALVSKPPPKTVSGLEAEGSSSGGASRRAGTSSNSCHGNSGSGGGAASSSSSHGSAGPAHSGSPWQQSVNVFGSWSRPDCVEELHQQAQQNLQSLLQDFEEQLYDCRLTGQTFRHPSSQDTPSPLCPSPVTLDDRRPDFIFLPASKQLYDDETASSVFGLRGVSDPSPSQSLSPSPCGSDRPPLGWSSHSNSSHTHANAAAVPAPPVADKPRWFSGRRATPGHHIPLDITGEGGRFLGVDLLQYSPSPGAHAGLQPYSLEPRSLEPVSDTPHQTLPLRKTHSDLDTSLAADPSLDAAPCALQVPGAMDHSGLLCSTNPSPSWNGPKGSTFSPSAWNEAYSYSVNKGPAVPPKQHSIGGHAHAKGPGSHCSSFTPDPSGGWKGAGHHHAAGVTMTTGMTMGRRSETEGAVASPTGEAGPAVDGGRGRERSARSIAAANAFKFRERSLSTPNDAGPAPYGLQEPSAGGQAPASNGGTRMAADHHFHHHHPHQQQHQHYQGLGENYALLYPSASSEDSGSTADSVSVAASDYSGGEGRLRLRSRSISLKKSKRKPPPPVRSVSLMKNLGEAEGPVHQHHQSLGKLYRDGRPKSLHIPREHYPDFQQDFLLPPSGMRSSKPSPGDGEPDHRLGGNGPPSLEIQGPDKQGEPELNFPGHWQLGDWKSDPYRSLSGSSTATGTTVIECMKVRGSSESLLDSPSVSRDASPSQFSMETDTKASSPFKPPGLMSPSSGYSSQSETPTPTVPSYQGTPAGPMGTLGCKMRPKIPERKSSLPSPKDPMARSRLSFEMPVNAHLDLSSLRPKTKASRRHSDTSTAAKPGKISPGVSAAAPVVTQNELKTVRLRSVSRGDLDDCPDGASDTIEEEGHGRDPDGDAGPPPPPTAPKPKPPVAAKPPLPKRPMNLLFKAPSPGSASTSPLAPPDSPPGSPVERPVPLGNIYKVMRKPKPKKLSPQTPNPPGPPETPQQQHHNAPYDLPYFPLSQSLFDLPPLPDPQPLIEDPGPEPESDTDPEPCVGPEDGGSLPSPCSGSEAPELRGKSNTLPSRITVSCLAELSEKKKPKVPPPVPKKPSVLLLQATVQPASNSSVDGRPLPPAQDGSPLGLRSPLGAALPEDLPISPSPFGGGGGGGGGLPDIPGVPEMEENHVEEEEVEEEEEEEEAEEEEEEEETSKESWLHEFSLPELEGKTAGAEIGPDEIEEHTTSPANERTELHITEETDDGIVPHTPTTHTTEDLFTIIHRSKRKVLGRKEPGDSFGSRQNLVSPVKHAAAAASTAAASVDIRSMTLGSSQKSSSRNENFMALLQKKGSKTSSGGARVSAMELLRSTNPLARRVTEFSSSSPPMTDTAGDSAQETTPGNGQ